MIAYPLRKISFLVAQSAVKASRSTHTSRFLHTSERHRESANNTRASLQYCLLMSVALSSILRRLGGSVLTVGVVHIAPRSARVPDASLGRAAVLPETNSLL